MKKKQKPNWFLRMLSFLFLVFICLYVTLESGYYESKLAKKTTMTEESIKKFEQDIKNNKPIDLDEYTFNKIKYYGNNTTDAAIYIGSKVEKFMSSGINDFFDILKSFVT